MNHAIHVENLTKVYGRPGTGVLAVDHVSFEVYQGEVFGFLGPNGAGKTTTLEIIEGVKRPTSGTARVLGMDIESDSRRISEVIGVQLQAASYFEHLRLAEILELFGSFSFAPDKTELNFFRWGGEAAGFWDVSGLNHVLALRLYVEALEQTGPFSAALIDLTLPDERGDILLGRLRKKGLVTRAAIMSGAPPPEDADPDGHPERWLRKPFDPSDLLVTIRELTEPDEAARSAS